MFAPQIWLIVLLGLSTPITYGVMYLKRDWAVTAAYDKGVVDGKNSVAATTVTTAVEAARIERAAEEEVPAVKEDRDAKIARCRQSASCKERNQFR